jgi:hypothetical protein
MHCVWDLLGHKSFRVCPGFRLTASHHRPLLYFGHTHYHVCCNVFVLVGWHFVNTTARLSKLSFKYVTEKKNQIVSQLRVFPCLVNFIRSQSSRSRLSIRQSRACISGPTGWHGIAWVDRASSRCLVAWQWTTLPGWTPTPNHWKTIPQMIFRYLPVVIPTLRQDRQEQWDPREYVVGHAPPPHEAGESFVGLGIGQNCRDGH